jgi:hypothetical protein
MLKNMSVIEAKRLTEIFNRVQDAVWDALNLVASVGETDVFGREIIDYPTVIRDVSYIDFVKARDEWDIILTSETSDDDTKALAEKMIDDLTREYYDGTYA